MEQTSFQPAANLRNSRDWIKTATSYTTFSAKRTRCRVVAAPVRGAELEKKAQCSRLEWAALSPRISSQGTVNGLFRIHPKLPPLVGVYCALPTFCWPDEPTTVGSASRSRVPSSEVSLSGQSPACFHRNRRTSELSSRAAANRLGVIYSSRLSRSFWSKEESAGRIDQCKFDTRFQLQIRNVVKRQSHDID